MQTSWIHSYPMTLSINFAWIKNLFQFIILSYKADQSTDHETEEACGFVTMLKNVLIFQIRSTPSPQNDLQALNLTPRKTLTWAHWTIWGRSNSSRKASNCCLAPSLDNSWSNPPVIHTQSQFLLNSNEMNVLRQKLVLDTEQMKMYCSVYTVFPFARKSNFSAEWKFW